MLQTKERNYLEMDLRRPFKPTETLWFMILGYINKLTRKFVDNMKKKIKPFSNLVFEKTHMSGVDKLNLRAFFFFFFGFRLGLCRLIVEPPC